MSKQPEPQAAPIPTSVVLGLNAWNCKSKISPANWETCLNEPVTINPGDSIFVKASYIDTRGTASSNIDILTDTEISMEYYFYHIHCFNACNGTLLTEPSLTPDISYNLTQQVLVGRSIPNLLALSGTNVIDPSGTNPIPAYLTSSDGSGNYNVTNLNDADALPYLVYQTIPNYPVPAYYGPVIPASQIVPGTSYLIVSQGLTTNWAWAGVPDISANVLPPSWDFKTSYFDAIENPNGVAVPLILPLDENPGMSPSAFLLPINVEPTLPYVSYMITVVGDTDWREIDPTIPAPGVSFSASQMVNGGFYTIDSPGDLNWLAWGAASNNPGEEFTCSIPPPAPPVLPIVLSNAFFLANAGDWFPPVAYTFGQDPSDNFTCTLNTDVDGNLIVESYTGTSGPNGWCALIAANPGEIIPWRLPQSLLGFSNGTPGIQAYVNIDTNDALINNNPINISQMQVGKEYTIVSSGGVDGSVPTFLWNMVGSFPEADTSTMVAGQIYQVIENDSNLNIPNTANGGLVGDCFISLGPVPLLTSYQFETGVTPNINTIVTLTLDEQTIYPTSNGFVDIIIEADASGNCYATQDSSFGGTPDPFLAGVDIVTTTIDGPAAAGYPTIAVELVSLRSNGDFLPTNSGITVFQQNPDVLTPFPKAAKLINISPPSDSFVCTANYTGTGSTSTVNELFYSLTSCVVNPGDGTDIYINGTVYETPIHVGSIIKSINRDPAPPSTGRAVLYVTPNINDGVVQAFSPATTKVDIRPVKKKWKMMLKAGSYDPNNLAEIISRSMSRQKVKRVNNVIGGPFGTQSTLNVPTDNIWANDVSNNAWADPFHTGANTFFDAKNLAVYNGQPPATDYNIDPDNDDMPFLFVPAMNGSPLVSSGFSQTKNYIYAEIPHPNAVGLNYLSPPDCYINLVPLLSDVRSVSPTIPATVLSDGYYSILPFYSQNCRPNGNSGIFPVAYGATQTSLLYNNESNGLFSFNYLHSPILAFLSSTNSDLTECTGHMYTSNAKANNLNSTFLYTSLIDKKSGVLLNTLKPDGFWRQLGFIPSELTVDLDNKPPGFQMTLNEFEAKTTGGFCGSSNIFNPTFHTVNSADQPSVPDTELLYLTCEQPAATPGAILNALSSSVTFPGLTFPGLTVGVKYIIVALGSWEIFHGPNTIQTDWSFCGGPVNAAVGMTFVAEINEAYPDIGCGVWPGWPTYLPLDRPEFVNNYPYVQVYNENPTTTNTQLQNTYFQVNNTNQLNAAGISTQRDSTGHYLIEITGYASNYLDDKSKYEVKSIVSTYYIGSAGSFVSQPFPDSYNFFHTGAPITLNNLKVRILDPYTMNEAIIGPNSSVYLQVNKMLTEMSVLQVPN
jgi:hypothetical protein